MAYLANRERKAAENHRVLRSMIRLHEPCGRTACPFVAVWELVSNAGRGGTSESFELNLSLDVVVGKNAATVKIGRKVVIGSTHCVCERALVWAHLVNGGAGEALDTKYAGESPGRSHQLFD